MLNLFSRFERDKIIKIFFLLLAQYFLLSFNTFAQHMISGKVIEKSTKEGAIGVTVVVKGKTLGTSTDVDGNFKLQVNSLSDTLVVKGVWYKNDSTLIPINDRVKLDLIVSYPDKACTPINISIDKIGMYVLGDLYNNLYGAGFEYILPFKMGVNTYIINVEYLSNYMNFDIIHYKVSSNRILGKYNNFDLKFRGRSLKMTNQQRFNDHRLYTQINIDDLILGLKLSPQFGISYNRSHFSEENFSNNMTGFMLGMNLLLPRPLYIQLETQITIYKNELDYIIQARRQWDKIMLSSRYEKFRTYESLAIGVGYEFGKLF
ncbi:carboxypeptidase-like regulatory domain-containing protein [Aureibacter tunicatorum]|uniref:Carboxypeptidase-like regulatory domain-containing protein n=1 Tax=Aureibacter tunicatorum TaxID=866807 RepID=A0AAE4BU72_9BACT|nr:carboxypeptidase-like regulatory domain-containing protein [Aureibacter tunicatorum]MDR6241496.1 hypothetical protein [Aureibacter tunicatorum]BDD06661.1 hypothetical protein AUTU_41440 [Aureibacter tunicatorum]